MSDLRAWGFGLTLWAVEVQDSEATHQNCRKRYATETAYMSRATLNRHVLFGKCVGGSIGRM